MNIGIFTDTYYPELNGVANSAWLLKRSLEALGHTVYVFTVSNPEAREKEKHVFRARSLPFLLLRERRMGLPVARLWYSKVEPLHLDIIHNQTEFSLGHLGHMTAIHFHLPLVHTYHTIYEDYTHYLHMPKFSDARLKKVVRTFSRYCCHTADSVIVPTQKVEHLVRSYGVKRDIHVIPTGVSLEKFRNPDPDEVARLKRELDVRAEDFTLLFVGRLSKEKNLEELVRMMPAVREHYPAVRLLIVGGGPARPDLEALCRELGLDREAVRFAGEAPWSQVQNYYALGDVFVNASNSETQGLTYLEAEAAGLPLLVRRDECLKGFLTNGREGFAFENQDEFVAYLELLMQDPKRFGSRAAETAYGYGELHFAKEVLKVYEETLAKGLVRDETRLGFHRMKKAASEIRKFFPRF